MDVKISHMSIMIVACVAVFLGMFNFMYDMGYRYDGSQKYNITVPGDTNASMRQIFTEINETGSNLKGTLTGQESWAKTLYSVFFNLPGDIAATVSVLGDSAATLAGLGVGQESKIPIPDWVLSVISIVIILIIVFTLIYFVSGRSV